MKNYLLKEEDFKDIFKNIVFFRNRKNSFIEIGYLEYKAIKLIKFYLYNGEIICVEGNIFMITLKKIEILLAKLDIKNLE